MHVGTRVGYVCTFVRCVYIDMYIFVLCVFVYARIYGVCVCVCAV